MRCKIDKLLGKQRIYRRKDEIQLLGKNVCLTNSTTHHHQEQEAP